MNRNLLLNAIRYVKPAAEEWTGGVTFKGRLRMERFEDELYLRATHPGLELFRKLPSSGDSFAAVVDLADVLAALGRGEKDVEVVVSSA